KFETDEEEIAWLLKREGNEKIEPLLEKIERKGREKIAERVREVREEEIARAAEAVAERERQVREEEAARAAERELNRARMSLYAILEARGLAVSDAVRERIERCSDADQLTAWSARAATAASADD